MKKHPVLAVLGAGLLAVSLLVAAIPSLQPDAPDYEALAERLVSQSANIQEGEIVFISGGVRDLELLENLAVHVRKQGAFPLVSLESDRMTRRMYTDVPEQYDAQEDRLFKELAGVIDAVINIETSETPDLLADVPPERMMARAKAAEPFMQVMQERGVKQVNLGNDLYPTAARAEQYGMAQEALADLFWKGVGVDYEQLQATGEAARRMLAEGDELHLTHPNGTDLRVRIGERPVFVSDGVLSEEDVQRGAAEVWLPAGEVYVTPVAGTAQGQVVLDRHFFQGQPIEGLTLTFEAGKLSTMTAASDLTALKAYYDAAGEGKDAFAVIDVGINPNVTVPPDSRMVAWMPAGMVTVSLGNNQWAGGDNTVSYGLPGHIPGATLTVDGVPLVQDGQLQVPAGPVDAAGN
jgi:aminopeptidase